MRTVWFSSIRMILTRYGGSKWRAGTRETEVRLDGWYEGGLWQHRNDGGGCASMRELSERVECPGTYVTE